MINLLRRTFSPERDYLRLFHRLLGVTPSNVELYKMALIHRSASISTEDGRLINNERLEFLGDAILEAVSSEMIFVEFSDMDEGDMTKLRSRIVSRDSLNRLASEIGLGEHVLSHLGGSFSSQRNVPGDALEALIGALYLDKGYDVASGVVGRLILSYLDLEELSHVERDFKSRIIEWAQKKRLSIEFLTDRDTGYSEVNPLFRSRLVVDGVVVGEGCGRTKKLGEQMASRVFFESLGGE
ncbi:MAG: ribonuclease III [Rikenellaceae bacterium]